MQKFSSWLSPIVALFFVTALSVTASSTIGTSISTGGDLAVTGNSLLTGTLGVTGATTLGTLTASTTAVGADIVLKAVDDTTISTVDTLTVRSALVDILVGTAGTDYTQFFMDPSSDELQIVTRADTNSFVTIQSNVTNDSGLAKIQTGAQAGSFSYISLDIKDSSGSFTSRYNIDNDSMDFDVAGGTDELTMTTGLSSFTGRVKLPTASAPPVACAGGTVAQVYFDTDINEPCYCNASAWTAMDGAGACS